MSYSLRPRDSPRLCVAKDPVLHFVSSSLNRTRVDKFSPFLVEPTKESLFKTQPSQTAHFDIKNCAGGCVGVERGWREWGGGGAAGER